MTFFEIYNGSDWLKMPVENPAWLDDNPDLHIVDKTSRLFFMTVILTLAVFLNGTIAYVLIRKRRLSTAGNQFTFSLSSSIFIGSTWTFISVLSSGIKGQWIMGQIMCQFTGFIHLLIMISSNLTMSMIAIDRYYAIVKPMKYHGELSRKRVIIMLSGTWIFSTILSMCPIVGWSQFAYQPALFTCTIVWNLHPVFSALVIIISFCVPFLIISVFYTNIYFAANLQHQACLKLKKEGSEDHAADIPGPSTPNPSPEIGAKRPLLNKRQKLFRDRLPWVVITYSSPAKALRTIVIILGGFLLSWTPLLGAVLLQMGGLRSSGLTFAGYFFHCTSSVSCPVVYGLMNKMIRKRVKILLSRGGKQKQAISVQYSPSYAGSFFDYLPRKISTGLPNIDPAEAIRMAKKFSSPFPKRKSIFGTLESDVPVKRERVETMTRIGSAPSLTYIKSPMSKRKDYIAQNPTFLTVPEEMCKRASPNFVVGTNVQQMQVDENDTPQFRGSDVEASIVLRVLKRVAAEKSEETAKYSTEADESETVDTKHKISAVRFLCSSSNNGEIDDLSLQMEVQDYTSNDNAIFNMASDFIDE